DAHRFVLVVVGHDRQHRTEDLLLGDRHVGADLGEDGGLDEIALVESLGGVGPAGDELGSLVDPLLDVAPYALTLCVGHHRAEPVNDTMSMSGCPAMASPTVGPVPVTRLNTPAGNPTSSMISARMKALSGVTSLGLSTTVQPAARAGATLAAIWWRG